MTKIRRVETKTEEIVVGEKGEVTLEKVTLSHIWQELHEGKPEGPYWRTIDRTLEKLLEAGYHVTSPEAKLREELVGLKAELREVKKKNEDLETSLQRWNEKSYEESDARQFGYRNPSY